MKLRQANDMAAITESLKRPGDERRPKSQIVNADAPVAVLGLILGTIAIYRGFRSPNHKPKRTR